MGWRIYRQLVPVLSVVLGRRLPDLATDPVGPGETKLEVPGYCQLDGFSCGAIAGWSAIRAVHLAAGRADFARFYADCSPCPNNGTEPWRLIRALRKNRVGVSHRIDLGFRGIARAVEGGFPVLAVIDEDEDDGVSHWIVIYGVGRRPNRVFICNQPRPFASKEEWGWQEFRRAWDPRGMGLICWGKQGPDCRDRPP